MQRTNRYPLTKWKRGCPNVWGHPLFLQINFSLRVKRGTEQETEIDESRNPMF